MSGWRIWLRLVGHMVMGHCEHHPRVDELLRELASRRSHD